MLPQANHMRIKIYINVYMHSLLLLSTLGKLNHLLSVLFLCFAKEVYVSLVEYLSNLRKAVMMSYIASEIKIFT